MITIEIPPKRKLELEHLVLDMNGTLSVDGKISEGVRSRLYSISKNLKLHLITADTFGTAHKEVEGLPLEFHTIKGEEGCKEKLELVQRLGSDKVVSIGNGYNDHLMLKESALSIVVIGKEGASVLAIMNAQIAVFSPEDALDMLINPKRITATLRK